MCVAGLSILGGVFGLFSFQSFFFVGEVSVVLLPLSVVLCNRKVVVDVTLKNDSCVSVEILSDYVRYAILILRLGLEYTFVKSYTNTLVISNIVSVCKHIQ